MNKQIASIHVAEQEVELAYFRNDYERVAEVLDIVAKNDLSGSANDYHNLAADVARDGDFTLASNVIEKGLQKYERSSDLLADAINYGSKSKTFAECFVYFQKLKKIQTNIGHGVHLTF